MLSAPPAKPESPAPLHQDQRPAPLFTSSPSPSSRTPFPASRTPTPSPIQTLLRLTENAAFLRTTDGRFYAQVWAGSRREIYALRSTAFRDWLIDGFYRACGEIPSDWTLRRTLMAAEATARFEGGSPSVFVRVGHGRNGNDNGDDSGHGNRDGNSNAEAVSPTY
jgi:hypothetical protein